MRRVLSFAALSLLAVSSAATAQRASASHQDNSNPPVELGVDAGLNSQLDGTNKATTFSAPIQQLRAGWFVSPTMSIEPTVRFVTTSVSGAGSLTAYGIGTGLLWHLSESRAANQWYVRPFVSFNGVSTSGASSSNFSFGGGMGIKMPMANRFATRFEANISRMNGSNGVPSMNSLNLLAGVSVYSH